MGKRRASGSTRRRGKRRKAKSIKSTRRRRPDANGCATRARRRAPDRAATCTQRPKPVPAPQRKPVAAAQPAAPAAPAARRKRCLECRRKKRWTRRGLCCVCYRDPLTRGRHFDPANTIRARSPDIRDALDLLAGIDFPAAAAGPCPGPLPGAEGSAERIEALGLRADARVCLFPCADAPWPLAEVARLFGVQVG